MAFRIEKQGKPQETAGRKSGAYSASAPWPTGCLVVGGVVVPRSVESMLGSTRAQFDVVFVDPPYAETDRAVGTVLGAVVPCMNPDAVVVVHRQSRSAMTLPDILTRVDERKYGDAVVTMIQRNPS